MTEAYYKLGEIRFTRKQCIFLILHIETLELGNWPVNPLGSGYIDIPLKSKRAKHEAHFTRPVEMAAEIKIRLRTTGDAGEALVDEIHAGITEFEDLSRPAKRAANYVSGWRRRRMSFTKWCYQQEARK